MRWTPSEIDTLTRLYPDTKTAALAEQLNRKIGMVHQKARALGLSKSKAFMSSASSGRIQTGEQIGSRFKKGHATWNKGIHFEAGGRSVETRFKAGNVPQTEKPIGHVRIDKKARYAERKVSDSPIQGERWKPVHVLNWEAENGPVPPDHFLIFRDKNQLNAGISNLALVNRKQHMELNTIHRYPPELKAVIRVRAELNRRISNAE